MSAISRYEVRLKCVELAVSLSNDQDELEVILEQSGRIYDWVNKVDGRNNHQSRKGGGYHKKPRRDQSRKRDYYNDYDEQQHVEHGNRQLPQSDLFD